MPKSEKQKIKLLRLYEYLVRESSEETPKSMGEIIRYLQNDGIACERKSIYSDIAVINEYYKGKDGKGIIRGGGPYYVLDADRKLGYDKMRFLLDAVQSAAFLTDNQTKELIHAIKQLAGSRQQENWDKNVIVLNQTKHKNSQVFRSIGLIDEAVARGKKIVFKYLNLGLHGKPVYQKNGEYYTDSPICLIFNNGFYYTICFSERHQETVLYRIDRMTDVFVSEENSNVAKQKSEFFRYDKKNLLTAFNMWSNKKSAQVTLLVDNKLIGDIFDKFGMSCQLKPYDEQHFTVKVGVPLNEQFYGWVMSFGTLMKILSPENVQNELKKILDDTLEQYKT